jgi:transcriptional regulator with XRE-family HTH domain
MDGKQLRAWRALNHFSQEQAAQLLGCSSKSILRYEKYPAGVAIPETIAAATLRISNTETVDEDPVIIPATHPHLYDRWRADKYVRNRLHPGYGKPIETIVRVSELATYVPPDPFKFSFGDMLQAEVDAQEGRKPK